MKIRDCKSVGIRSEAAKLGIEEIELIADNGETGDARVEIYQVGPVRVASTNGDPIWEEEDPRAFAEFIEIEGLELGESK